MADPVTRHVLVTDGPREFRNVGCGIDSLDVGLHVHLGSQSYKPWIDRLIVQRELARKSDKPIVWTNGPLGTCLMFARGKSSMHQFHVQTEEGHFFFQAQSEPVNGTPNVLVSPHAKLLWMHGVDRAMELIVERLRLIGADVRAICPSRCDITADFEMPDALTLEFIRTYCVCKSKSMTHYMTGDRLETCYFGKRGADIQIRIYDKSLEVERGRFEKAWFYEDVWKVPILTRVWRVEAQIRRTILRKFSINSVEDLKRSLNPLWEYLTSEWLSFRLLDDSNTSRRTVHLWWQHVQRCASVLGHESNLIRAQANGEAADADWYVRRRAGYLASYAAAKGILDTRDAAEAAFEDELAYWNERDWKEAIDRKRLELGKPELEAEDDDDVPF